MLVEITKGYQNNKFLYHNSLPYGFFEKNPGGECAKIIGLIKTVNGQLLYFFMN